MKLVKFILGMSALAPLLSLGDSWSPTPPFWSGSSDVLVDTCSTQIDCRTSFPVANLENDPALQNLAYSAVGWGLVPTEDPSRKVTIIAKSGALTADGFVWDGTPAVEVLPATTGRGFVNWKPTEILRKVYQLTHSVMNGDGVDTSSTLYGYLDFTHCVNRASQSAVEKAVLGAITHAIVVVQDEFYPWQPIPVAGLRPGIGTDEYLESGVQTATTFAFAGRGVFHYEYELSSGTLEVFVDGECVSTFTEPTTGWVSLEVPFVDGGAHECAFSYTADGGGTARIRNVRWEEPEISKYLEDSFQNVRADLREGVRKPVRYSEVLPFEYSSTNWIGDVAGVSADSVARVSIVRLMGTDPDVRNWTDEVPNTFRVLVQKSGEGAVVWGPKKGVWKAAFEIENGGAELHHEEVIFDLRDSQGPGLLLLLL